jgi:hypothetical protein
MLSTRQERVYFQAFQPKSLIHSNKSNENIYDSFDGEYGFSSNNINIEEKEDLNENETKEEIKEEKKRNSTTKFFNFFQNHGSDQQKELEKMMNNICLNILVSHIPKKKVLKY